MTSLGRVGRILAGTIDVSSSSYEKDGQSSNNVKIPVSSSNHVTQSKAPESVDLRDVDTQSNVSTTSTLMQGMHFITIFICYLWRILFKMNFVNDFLRIFIPL